MLSTPIGTVMVGTRNRVLQSDRVHCIETATFSRQSEGLLGTGRYLAGGR